MKMEIRVNRFTTDYDFRPRIDDFAEYLDAEKVEIVFEKKFLKTAQKIKKYAENYDLKVKISEEI